jgi:protein TonB
MLASRIAPYRIAFIVVGVLLFHLAALWALLSGLPRPAVAVVVPVQLLREFVSPAVPHAAAKPPKAQVVPRPPAPPSVVPRQNPTPPSLQPLAVANAPPTASAPVDVVTAQPVAPLVAAPLAAAPGLPKPVAAKVDLPSTDADYLNNPKPVYPPLSKRAGEQGRVVVHVLIGADGLPQKADITTSSGFERLDQAALTTVLRWRYLPGKRAGVAEAMWFNVPINFVLE